MNLQENDFILAIKNYEDIVLSMPVLSKEVALNDLPELYRLFITISVLLRDYDAELIDLLHKRWEDINEKYKLKMLEVLNEVVRDEKTDVCVLYNKDSEAKNGIDAEISVATKDELSDILNFSGSVIEPTCVTTDRSIRG